LEDLEDPPQVGALVRVGPGLAWRGLPPNVRARTA
jgi:hypothetical protein